MGSQLKRSASRHPFVVALGALALISLLFLLRPDMDLAVAALFYQAGSGFMHERIAALQEIREAGTTAEWALAALLAAPLLLKAVLPDRPILLPPRATLFMFATLALGPGLIVNAVLKEHWGRARPRDLLQFGGEATFSPVWWISDQCGGNCSFASGEAAGAFWLVGLAFLAPRPWRLPVAAVTLAFAALISFTRIAMGGHFVSDVLIAWMLVLLVMILLDRAILRGLPPAFDGRVERALAAPARSLRAALRGRGPPL